jgi:hypothetical protein
MLAGELPREQPNSVVAIVVAADDLRLLIGMARAGAQFWQREHSECLIDLGDALAPLLAEEGDE